MGQKNQRLEDHEKRLEELEEVSRSTTKIVIETAAKTEMIYDIVKRLEDKL